MKIRFLPEQCVGCGACVTACIDQNDTPIAGGAPARLRIRETYQIQEGHCHISYARDACRHCPSMPCAKGCPSGAIQKDTQTGFVWINLAVCTGCGLCQAACPFHAIHFVENRPDKCDGCLQRVAQGYSPACVHACLTQALILEK